MKKYQVRLHDEQAEYVDREVKENKEENASSVIRRMFTKGFKSEQHNAKNQKQDETRSNT